MKLTAFVLLSLIVVTLLVAWQDTIPPHALTATRMTGMLYRQFPAYIKEHHRLPDQLSELPEFEDYDNSIEDAWGRPLIYEKEGRKVTLRSLGKDGKMGGEGKNADIVQTLSFDGVK